MKKFKKLISGLLVVSMVLSVAAVSSYADEQAATDESPGIEAEVTEVTDESPVEPEINADLVSGGEETDQVDVSEDADTDVETPEVVEEVPTEETEEPEEAPYKVVATIYRTGSGLYGTEQGRYDAYVSSAYGFEDKAEFDSKTIISNAELDKLIYTAYADMDNKTEYAKSMAAAGSYLDSYYNGIASNISIPEIEVPSGMKVYLLDDSRTPQRYDGMYYDCGGSVKDAKEAVKAAEEDNEGEANTDTDAQVADDSEDDGSDDDGEADQQDGEDGLVDGESQILLLPEDPFDALGAASTTNWVTYKNWRKNHDNYEWINSIQYLYMSSLTGNAAICINNNANGANPSGMLVTEGSDATPAAYDVTASEVNDVKYKRLFYYAYKNNYFYNTTPGTANTVTGNTELETRARKETNLHIAICLLNGSLDTSDPLYSGLSDANKADVQKLMNVYNGVGEYSTLSTNITVYLLTPSNNSNNYQSLMTFVPGKNYVAVQKQDSISGQTVNGAVADIYGSNTAATSGGTKIGTLNLNPTGVLEVTDYVDTYKYFYAVETKAPANYVLNDTPVALTVTDNDSPAANEIAIIKDSRITRLTIKKKSADTSCSDGNPNYSLDGTVFGMYKGDTLLHRFYINADGNVYKVDNTETSSVEVQSALDKNPNSGNYVDTRVTFKELSVGKGFKKAPDKTYTIKANTTELQVVDIENTPEKDPFKIKVVKKGIDGALANATFGIKYYKVDTSIDYSCDDLSKMTPDETAEITTSLQGDGKIWADLDKYYPYGYITVEETKAPTGFSDVPVSVTMNGKSVDYPIVVKLVSKGNATDGYTFGGQEVLLLDGTWSHITEMTTLTLDVDDTPKRGDLSFEKVDENGDPLAGVKFTIYNRITGEEVTVVTDEDGKFSTENSYAAHSKNTNAGTAKCGTWFKMLRQGKTEETPNDKAGALPVGKYTVTEVDANGKQLAEPETKEVVEGQTTVFFDSGRTDGEQKFTNMPAPILGTEAFLETQKGKIKTLPAKPGQTVTDICDVKYLKVGETYTLIGKLMLIGKDGSLTEFATGREVFTIPDGYKKSLYEGEKKVKVQFKDLDLTNFKGCNFVAYERLYLGDVTEDDVKNNNFAKNYGNNNTVVEFPLIHEDKDDDKQTVKVPDGGTTATDEDGTKTVASVGIVTIVDTIKYEGLEVGKTYEVEGCLYVKPKDAKKSYTEQELEALKLLGPDNKPVTSKKSFTATSEKGSVQITFTFDASALKKESRKIVAFEWFREEESGVEVFTHADINDLPQTTFEPIIWTTAKGTNGRSELLYKEGKFIDTVNYENLAPGTYTINGWVMDKDTGKELILNGKKVTGTATVTVTGTEPKDGSVDVTFTISEDMQKELEGKNIVVYEELINSKGKVKAEHKEINDKGQQLTVPHLRTKLLDKITKTHVVYPDEIVTLVDTCSYTNLIPGKEYVMSGTLMNRNTGNKLLDQNGKEITASKPFTASATGAGIVELEFTFNAKILKLQGTRIVAFERVIPSDGDIPVAVHEEIDDDEQTVDVPEVFTKVGKAKWSSKEVIKLTDTVSFTNLRPRYTYVFKGWIVDKNGNPIKVDGKEIRIEKEFVPTTADGTVDMVFPDFSAKDLKGEYVVFEEVYVQVNGAQKIVGEHKKLDDSNQTFTVTPETPPGPPTGDTTNILLAAILMLMAASGAAFVIFKKRQRA
ncbi:MAG: VaFE repeat-containing surface-anchored protein [Eubacterium sp.]|nr:VaFE repeat-containing surface-anchored protein [Eubacterium sp.]